MSPVFVGVTGLDTYGLNGPKFRLYMQHVKAAGGVPVPLGRKHLKLPKHLSGLLLAGGEDVDPAFYSHQTHPTYRGNRGRDTSEFLLGREAVDRGMPTLAICRGAQLLNVLLGGTLVQDIPSQVKQPLVHAKGARHGLSLAPGTHLAALAHGLNVEVNSYHHQAVERIALGLQVSAKAPDGVVEAWEPDPQGPYRSYLMAVQYHPERDPLATDNLSTRLFRDFVTTAAGWS